MVHRIDAGVLREILESGDLGQTHNGVLAMLAWTFVEAAQGTLGRIDYDSVPARSPNFRMALTTSSSTLPGVQEAPPAALRPPFHHPGRCILLHMRNYPG